MWYSKILDVVGNIAKPVIDLIDKSNLTKQEKQEITLKMQEFQIEALKEANKLNILDSQSTSKYRSFARPTFLYLFYALILLSLPIGLLNYLNNDFYLALVDGMKTYLSIIPEYMITGFLTIIGVLGVGRTIEKINGLK